MPKDKPKIDTAWQDNIWYKRANEFYEICYKGGQCRYCHKEILTPLDHCNCAGMQNARAKFKRLISGLPLQKKQKPIDYNPDEYCEQETEELP